MTKRAPEKRMTETEKLALLREAIREILDLSTANSAVKLIADTAMRATLR
jgi:hypothetical protein